MFEIEYKGANCVAITNKKSKIITDPCLSQVGLKDVSIKNVIELLTEERFAVSEDPDTVLVINGPGQYGVAGFDIYGIPAQRHLDDEKQSLLSTMYRIEVDGARIGLLGNIYERLTDEQLERLGVLDVLVLPVGGNGYTLDAVGASGLVRQIDPKIVIPVHYADKSLRYEVPQDDLDRFIKELGAPVETMPKYKFKPNNNEVAALTVIELTRS